MKTSALTSLLLVALCTPLMAVDFHVAPSGDDGNPGTRDKPFQTISRARDAVAKVNARMTGDITVHLANGSYVLAESLVFGPKDSGQNGHKVIYKAFKGHHPVVSGGRVIKGWQIHDRDKNIHKAPVGDLEFRQIHVNQIRGIRARFPDQTNPITLEGYLAGGNVTGQVPYKFQVKPDELKGWETWSNLNEVEVVMVTHWKQKRARISAIEGNTISVQEPESKARSMFHMEQPGTPHFYENCYEFLDAEGEFYLNTKTDTLFYKPRPGEDMSKAEVVVPTVETLVNIKGESPGRMVENLVFDGITFEYSNWTQPNQTGFQTMQSATWYSDAGNHFVSNLPVPAAVQLENAGNVEIRNCTVRRTSSHGIAAIRDVVGDCSFVGNHVVDAGAGGIYLLLNHEKSTGNKITDNTIEHIGVTYSNACGILIARTPDVAVSHNEIRHVRYTGISTGWSWDDKDSAAKNHDISYNLIHQVMGLHDDGGGIYTLGKIPGMVMRNNYIHNITRSKFAGNYGICGIYLDNGSCHKLVQDNVIENVEAAFFSGNKPNYKNIFERNYHMCPFAKIVEKANIVRDNVEVKKGTAWPAAAREIIKQAGPRGNFRRPDPRP